jgi:hypothetical protein
LSVEEKCKALEEIKIEEDKRRVSGIWSCKSYDPNNLETERSDFDEAVFKQQKK